ncbi:AbiTii domain-containing protein [Neisseria subflava]|uniref:AbiTii domain-containing protein n=1 Tax=Neisseria subflava TaxID=28449 RepID=UPI0027E1BF5F|nr:hypothetical protein [Neisseria subflava]
MSIILELQELAANPNSDVEELLNKTFMVARKLKISQLIDWCNNELLGYKTNNIPDYRKIYGELMVFNPYRGLIPFSVPESIRELVTLIEYRSPVSEIRNLILNSQNGKFVWDMPNDVKLSLMQIQNSHVKLEPKVIVHKTDLMNIQSNIRKFILNWALKLEEDGILGEGVQFSKHEKELAMTNQFNIQNMQGFVGNISSGNIQQNIYDGIHIERGNFDSLADFLIKNGIPYSELSELKIAFNEDITPTDAKNFGGKVSEWIGNIVAKASSGIIDIPAATIAGLLTNAISKYYGIS